jgi:biopolymer transport protein ExbD
LALRGKRKKDEHVPEVPITPMLDMAFQLLTFFILTYHPMPTEVQFIMNLMPAAPATDFRAQSEAESTAANPDIPAALRTLPTLLRAGEGGMLGRVTLGENDVQGMAALKTELKTILEDPTLPFDQALIKVDPDLRYSELMQVIDVFSALKVTKISFAELTPDEEGGGGP